METKSLALEFTVLSAEELRVDNRYLKKSAFAVVSIDPHNFRMTKIDSEGGSHPAWKEKFVIDLPSQQRFITLEVKCRTSSGEKSIGSVKVPVSEFIGGYTPANCLQFLSYRLLDARGNRNGIINFSVRVKGQEMACSSQAAGIGKIPIDGTRNFGGIVTGIPVWSVTR
ncbi:hypothetical protein SLA2020_491530 [Shorea laevis]